RAFEWHVHRCDTERAAGKHDAVHALGYGVTDDVRCEDVGARREMRSVLLDASGGQDDEWMTLELRRDLGLRQLPEIPAHRHRRCRRHHASTASEPILARVSSRTSATRTYCP